MNKAKIIRIIFITILLASNILYILQVNKDKILLSRMASTLDLVNGSYSIVKKSYLYQVLYNDVVIDKNCELTNSIGEQIHINEILIQKKNLFLRLPEFSCTSCYEKLFDNSKVIDSIYYGKIVILATFKSVNSLNNFKRINQIFYDSYNVNMKNIITFSNIEKLQKPYFIEISEDGNVCSLHLIDKNNISFTLEYLNTLNDKLK